MTSPAGNWRIGRIANSARRFLASLDLESQERLISALESLQLDPFSGDIKKVKGKENLFRLRLESYRVYYRVDRSMRSIEIVLIDKRGQIKLKSIECL